MYTLVDLGFSMMALSKYERARKYLSEALTITEETKNDLGKLRVEYRLGRLELKLERIDEARSRFENNLNSELIEVDLILKNINKIGLAQVYEKQGAYEKAHQLTQDVLRSEGEFSNSENVSKAKEIAGRVQGKLN